MRFNFKIELNIIKDKLYNLFWRFKATRLKAISQEKELLLVLGVGRSGTTWVSNTLAKTQVPMRFFEEPLYHIKPKLNLSGTKDHTAFNKRISFSKKHRLIICFNIFTVKNFDFERFIGDKFIKRFDFNYRKVLVKEVHSLLATEAIMKFTKSKAILITRNPYIVVDSIASLHNSYSFPILTDEFIYLYRSSFINDNFPDLSKVYNNCIHEIVIRKQKLFEKLFTVFIINKWFHIISDNRCHNVRYEELINDPENKFQELSTFFGLDWEKTHISLIKLHMKKKPIL